MTVCNQPSTENCPETCPNYFLDRCPVLTGEARQKIINAGLKELPAQLHATWAWWAQRTALTSNLDPVLYIAAFRDELDW